MHFFSAMFKHLCSANRGTQALLQREVFKHFCSANKKSNAREKAETKENTYLQDVQLH
jgi:hypothetical protein